MSYRKSRSKKESSKKRNQQLVGHKKPKFPYVELEVIRKQQKSIVWYSGEMSVEELASLTYVDNYDGTRARIKGYQRNFSEAKGLEFAKFINDPTNACLGEILLNDRDEAAEFISANQLWPEAPNHKLFVVTGVLRIPRNTKLRVYDGQTRRMGYLHLLNLDEKLLNIEHYCHLKIPFCLAQVTYDQEVEFFLLHNGRQSKVKSNHRSVVSFDLNSHLVESNMKNYTIDEKRKTIIGGAIRKLNELSGSPWHGMISMPDSKTPQEQVGLSGSFITGVSKIIAWMDNHYWGEHMTIEEKASDLATYLITYWCALKLICPKVWRSPRNYVMLKNQGICSLTILMKNLMIDLFNQNKDWTIDNLKVLLKKSNLLRTPIAWENNGRISAFGGGWKSYEKMQDLIYSQIREKF